MRILQLIDSLEAGGAERMAVNFANVLAKQVEFSGLVCTRAEGPLQKTLSNEAAYFFMCKKSALDFKALYRLQSFVKKNKVEIIQAHSSSFFTAVLLKILMPKLKIFWHDHYGNRSNMPQFSRYVLQICSMFFTGILVVNEHLKIWAQKYLSCKNIMFLENFISEQKRLTGLHLPGENGKRIIQIANLKYPKNHVLSLEVAKIVSEKYPNWTFHFIGKDFKDAYSENLVKIIDDSNLKSQVFFHFNTQIDDYINQAEICILTSESEGLPVSVLEYGKFSKAVVATQVGQIDVVIENGKSGFLVPSGEASIFAEKVIELIEDESLREQFGKNLFQKVKNNFTFDAVSDSYFNFIRSAKQ
ncbi:glycosyltransferase [Flavobacterium sp. NST-5]|uniref:Glycosyltransferase n=1 Tax=Flavobacterium ichthyis TaxID=2698827 RepID=A0ABW9Z9Q9_9FLAO|nr:glycosyltransferase [Flavobacterium ichthyis]NBL64850.1 glycosyltransferase [Flavobacterium ichthyis]